MQRRLFIAVDLSEEARERLALTLEKLREAAQTHPDLKIGWARPAQLHLTLKFLGPVEEERIAAIARTIGRVMAAVKGFEATIQGFGSFPPGARNARILWAGVQGSGFATLAQGLDEALHEAHGFARETRAFSAHLTLGRVKQGRNAGGLLQAAPPVQVSFPVSEVRLYESRTLPEGAVYSVRERFKLSAFP